MFIRDSLYAHVNYLVILYANGASAYVVRKQLDRALAKPCRCLLYTSGSYGEALFQSVITHYYTFIHTGCKVPWALPRGNAVTAVTSADHGKMSAPFPDVYKRQVVITEIPFEFFKNRGIGSDNEKVPDMVLRVKVSDKGSHQASLADAGRQSKSQGHKVTLKIGAEDVYKRQHEYRYMRSP